MVYRPDCILTLVQKETVLLDAVGTSVDAFGKAYGSKKCVLERYP